MYEGSFWRRASVTRSAVWRVEDPGLLAVVSFGRGRCVRTEGPKWVYAYLWEGVVSVSEARRSDMKNESLFSLSLLVKSLSGWYLAARRRKRDLISRSLVVYGSNESSV